ncbi:Nudix family hydrolase [Kaarinaea lacus]
MSDSIHVAVAVIRNPAGEVFVTLRPDHVHQGGLWEFPGGKIEEQESVYDALVREIHEENGIDILRAQPLIKIPYCYPDKAVLLDVWEVLEFSGKAHGKEGQACRWVRADELRQLEFPAANHPIITAVQLPSKYLITPEPGENTSEFLEQLETRLAGGIKLVQLRAKQLADDRYLILAKAVTELCYRYHAKVLLNSDLQILNEVSANGIHLTAQRLMQLEQRPLAGENLLAASCHSIAEIEQANRVGADFIVLSPVKPTISHPTAKVLGWATFKEWTERAAMPVYALGGMTPSDIKSSRENGGQGIAAISALWKLK